jgi:hypothetical protein
VAHINRVTSVKYISICGAGWIKFTMQGDWDSHARLGEGAHSSSFPLTICIRYLRSIMVVFWLIISISNFFLLLTVSQVH